MCIQCWKDHYESAQIDSPAVRYAASLIGRVYDEISLVGAPFHVELDDWNISSDFEPYRLDLIDEDQRPLALECGAAMKALTIPERASALALFDGFWG